MFYLSRMFLISVIAVVLRAAAMASAWAQVVQPACTPAMLDIRVWPAAESNVASGAHLLVIEIQNRSPTTCRLEDNLYFYPRNSGWPDGWYTDPSDAARALKDRKYNAIASGEWVHKVLIWSSQPAPLGEMPFYACGSYPDLLLTFDYRKPQVKVHNLNVKACNDLWLSNYRLGRYSPDEPLPPGWLKRFDLKAGDVTSSLPVQPKDASPDAPEASLRYPYQVEFLGDLQQLFLQVPNPAKRGCPFEVMRKRNADGETTVYVNHCDSGMLPPAQPASEGRRKTENRIDIRFLELTPEKTGVVEYDAVSTVRENNSLLLVRSPTIRILMRDGKERILPAIDTKLLPCLASQLTRSGQPVRLGQYWKTPMGYADPGEERDFAQAYEVTNTSDHTCLLGGAPDLHYFEAPGKGEGLVFPPCINCPTPLFRPRETVWIDLKPGDSAHFLVATKIFDRDYWWVCYNIGTIELTFPGGAAIALPFEASVCGQVSVSSWRAGAYDGDPTNDHYKREKESSAQPPPLPQECAGADLDLLGHPIWTERRKGVFFGLSAGTRSSRYGERIPLYFWAVNQTDRNQELSSCQDLDWFLSEGFWIFDSQGHRVRSLREERSGWTSPLTDGCSLMCTRDEPFDVPAHTCFKPGGSQNLADSFFLPPGEYLLRLLKTDGCKIVPETALSAEALGGVKIKIDPQ